MSLILSNVHRGRHHKHPCEQHGARNKTGYVGGTPISLESFWRLFSTQPYTHFLYDYWTRLFSISISALHLLSRLLNVISLQCTQRPRHKQFLLRLCRVILLSNQNATQSISIIPCQTIISSCIYVCVAGCLGRLESFEGIPEWCAVGVNCRHCPSPNSCQWPTHKIRQKEPFHHHFYRIPSIEPWGRSSRCSIWTWFLWLVQILHSCEREGWGEHAETSFNHEEMQCRRIKDGDHIDTDILVNQQTTQQHTHVPNATVSIFINLGKGQPIFIILSQVR